MPHPVNIQLLWCGGLNLTFANIAKVFGKYRIPTDRPIHLPLWIAKNSHDIALVHTGPGGYHGPLGIATEALESIHHELPKNAILTDSARSQLGNVKQHKKKNATADGLSNKARFLRLAECDLMLNAIQHLAAISPVWLVLSNSGSEKTKELPHIAINLSEYNAGQLLEFPHNTRVTFESSRSQYLRKPMRKIK